MACGVTLKRAIDLDALHSPEHSIKRRRTSCNHSPFHPAASGFASGASLVACGIHHNSEQRPLNIIENATSNTAKVSSDLDAADTLISNQLNSAANYSGTSLVRTSENSIDDDASAEEKDAWRKHGIVKTRGYTEYEEAISFFGRNLKKNELYAFLRKELHLLRKRRAPNERSSSPGDGYSRGSDSPLSDSDGEQQQRTSFLVQQPHVATVTPMEFQSGSISGVSLRDKPLFSFTQVRNICERLLKEQETRLSIEYEKVLNEKLAEQHETFVRFTYDQIHRRYEDSPMSYLS